jgi:hypothetical protein
VNTAACVERKGGKEVSGGQGKNHARELPPSKKVKRRVHCEGSRHARRVPNRRRREMRAKKKRKRPRVRGARAVQSSVGARVRVTVCSHVIARHVVCTQRTSSSLLPSSSGASAPTGIARARALVVVKPARRKPGRRRSTEDAAAADCFCGCRAREPDVAHARETSAPALWATAADIPPEVTRVDLAVFASPPSVRPGVLSVRGRHSLKSARRRTRQNLQIFVFH